MAGGDPTATALLLWTRITATPDAVPGSGRGPASTGRWEVAADETFSVILQGGSTRTSAARDHTAKVVVRRLKPYTRYFYRFKGCGTVSPVGRTQAAPDGAGVTHALRLAFVSCSNDTGGFFTAYRGLAARDDLDAILHLVHDVYEYGNDPAEPGVAGSGDRDGPAALIGTRDHQPATEMVSLEDYRVRHALYKSDPYAQAAHRRHSWIVIFDDHEIANDASATGAEKHGKRDDPDSSYTGPGQPSGIRPEGEFLARRAKAFQAYIEWMPIWLPTSTSRSGTGADSSSGASASATSPTSPSSRPGRTGAGRCPPPPTGRSTQALADPNRHLPEPEQMRWLTAGRTPRRDGQGVHRPGGTDRRHPLLVGKRPAARPDDLPGEPKFGGVEFVCPSVTSDGFKEVLGSATVAQGATVAFQTVTPWVRFLQGIGHRFAVLDATPERGADRFMVCAKRRGQGPAG